MSIKKLKVAIIGAGEIGSALGSVLKAQGVTADYFDKDPRKASETKPLEDVLSGASVVFICVSSWHLREALTEINGQLAKDALVLTFAKGIESVTLKTVDQILAAELPPGQHFGIFGGPMLSEEILQGKAGVGVIGTADKQDFHKLLEVFKGTNLTLEYSGDVRGVALVAALKNVYAIGLGIADGLGRGSNMKGFLTALAVHEMAEITEILGGQRKTTFGVAGIGDLVATGFSPLSRNRRVGNDLIQTGRSHLHSEGIVSVEALSKMLNGKTKNYPFLRVMERVIVDGEPAQKAYEIFEGALKDAV